MSGKFFVVILLAAVACATPADRLSDEESQILQKNMEKGGFFEGDMRFPEGMSGRNGLVNTSYRWTSKTLYYQLDSGFTTEQRNAIFAALNEIQSATCIKFVQRTNQANYVQVEKANSGCWSYVGMLKGKQVLNLQVPGCIYHMGIMHEFIHALGFYHMQSASNRDNYVTILLQNVATANRHNYDKYSSSTVTDFGVTYDYESVMHYYDTAFSMNGEKTIITKDPAYQNIIGRVNHLSRADIEKINRMYSC